MLTEQVEILKTELYQDGGSKAPAWTIVPENRNEGLKTSAQVQYVAGAETSGKAGLPYTGSA